MKSERRSGRRRVIAAVLLGAALAAVPAAARAQLPFFGNKSDYKPFNDPGGRFHLDQPKDWQVTAGVGDVLFTFAQKKGEAALVIEHFRLSDTPGEISELFGQLEADTLKQRQPLASDLVMKILGSNGRPVITIDYARPGLAGPEKGRQYTFPIGLDLYRLNCTAAAALFPKYDSIFVRIATSFAPSAGGPPAAPAATQGAPQKK